MASLTSTLIQQRCLEKWDGKLPQFSAGGLTRGMLFNLPIPPRRQGNPEHPHPWPDCLSGKRREQGCEVPFRGGQRVGLSGQVLWSNAKQPRWHG